MRGPTGAETSPRGDVGARTGGGVPAMGTTTATQATHAGDGYEGLVECYNVDICLCVTIPISIHTCSHLSFLMKCFVKISAAITSETHS